MSTVTELSNEALETIGNYVRSHLALWLHEVTPSGYAERDIALRERTVRVEEELKTQRELMCQGFEQMEKRFEQTDKRFEQVDKRFLDMHQYSPTDTSPPLTIIGFYLHPYARTGGHRRYLELINGLALRGNRCVLFLGPHFTPHTTPNVQTVQLQPAVGRGLLPRSLQYALQIRRALKPGATRALPSQPDAVVAFGESHYFVARVASRFFGCPLVFAFRSLPVEVGFIDRAEPGRSLSARLRISARIAKYRWYERTIGRHADRIVFQSSHDQSRFLSRVPVAASRTAVIRGNIAPPWFTAESRDTNHSTACRRIVFVGSVGERKGVRYLVRAFSAVAAELPDLSLVIVGDGTGLSELQQMVASRALQQRVHFLGYVPDPLPLIADADLLIVPSLFDSYPNTVLEALHVGTPVIASRSGGIPDMLEHEELLFPPGSVDAIAERIRLLVTDSAAYRHARELCLARRAYFEFDWPAEWERILS